MNEYDEPEVGEYVPTMTQNIENFSGTKEIILEGGGQSDVEAGIEFIYHMREHLVDIGIATVYGLAVYAAVLWITKKIKGND
tara:strand:- start:511 stop:756 length:246 start_codon:yes stop_codon:yes gene_type:complete